MVSSVKQPEPAFCRPKGDFVLIIPLLNGQARRFEVGRFYPDDGKRITMWKCNGPVLIILKF